MNIIDQDKLGNNFKEKLVQESDDIIRELILLLLSNNLGASYEKVHNENLAISFWEEVNSIIENLINSNPRRAIGIAVFLITLPKHNDSSVEWKYRYLRGNGLAIMADKRLAECVQLFLETPQSLPLINLLLSFIDNTEIEQWDRSTALSTPEFFSMVAALKIAMNLEENPKSEASRKIAHAARLKLSSERVRNQIAWYLEIPDTKALAESLLENNRAS
jgi:hypothetical protein